MNVFVHILKALWAMHFRRFWLIWFTTTAGAVIYVRSMVGNVATPRSQKTTRPALVVLMRRQMWTPRAIVALMLLAVFLASYIAMILVWEDFAHYDNDFFILYTLKGYNFPPIIWQDDGRFCPFGLQEFNLIRHFTKTPTGYHLLPVAQLLVFFSILLILDAELSIT